MVLKSFHYVNVCGVRTLLLGLLHYMASITVLFEAILNLLQVKKSILWYFFNGQFLLSKERRY